MFSMLGYFIAFKEVANADKTKIPVKAILLKTKIRVLKVCLLYVQYISISLFLFCVIDNSFCRYILCSVINCINVLPRN